MRDDALVMDNLLPDPEAYRRAALACNFRTFDFPEAATTFHGIAIPALPDLVLRLTELFPQAMPTMSFFRKSPAGQVEPHWIHTDIDMGDWTALLYLNPDPPAGDGTVFWEHLETRAKGSAVPHERSIEGRTRDGWEPWRIVEARFNRLVVFPATFYHSRAIFDNWGAGDEARLVQVVFGRGEV